MPTPSTTQRRSSSHAVARLGALLATLTTALRSAVVRVHRTAEAGMTTAEYAVGTVAAVSFAAALIAVVRSGAIKAALTSIITGALHVG